MHLLNTNKLVKKKIENSETKHTAHLHDIIPHNCEVTSSYLHPHHHPTSIWIPHIGHFNNSNEKNPFTKYKQTCQKK